jgi:hypothetical protein
MNASMNSGKYLFAPGLRSPVPSCPNLSLPVYLGEGITGRKRWEDGGMREGAPTVRSQVLYLAELRERERGKSSYCRGNPASIAFQKAPNFTPKVAVVFTGFAVRSAILSNIQREIRKMMPFISEWTVQKNLLDPPSLEPLPPVH